MKQTQKGVGPSLCKQGEPVIFKLRISKLSIFLHELFSLRWDYAISTCLIDLLFYNNWKAVLYVPVLKL